MLYYCYPFSQRNQMTEKLIAIFFTFSIIFLVHFFFLSLAICQYFIWYFICNYCFSLKPHSDKNLIIGVFLLMEDIKKIKLEVAFMSIFFI